MTTNQVEERLRRYVDDQCASVDPITAADAMGRSPSRGSGPWLAGAAAVVLVALAFVGMAIVGDDDETQVATAPVEEDSDTPPPAELAPLSDDVELWLSATEVPPGDHRVVAALWEDTEVHATFGVVSEVERWDGTRWTPIGVLLLCGDLGCTASIRDGNTSVPQIGFEPEAGVPFILGRVSVSGLEEGWYRISQAPHEGVIASGVLHVTSDALAPAPLTPIDAPSIRVRPSIIGTEGGPASLGLPVPSRPGDGSIEDIAAHVVGMEEVRLQRWDGQVWATLAELPLEPREHSLIRTVELPALEPGAYQLVWESPGEPHAGNFWVADGSLAPAPVGEVPRDHEIRLDDPPLVVRVELPPGLRQPPNPRDPGTGPTYVENWLDASTGGGASISIQPDPGDDALLFRLPVIARFETPLGSWTVVEIGGDVWARPMAMLRHDGLVYQLSGGRRGDLAVVRSMATSLEVERLAP